MIHTGLIIWNQVCTGLWPVYAWFNNNRLVYFRLIIHSILFVNYGPVLCTAHFDILGRYSYVLSLILPHKIWSYCIVHSMYTFIKTHIWAYSSKNKPCDDMGSLWIYDLYKQIAVYIKARCYIHKLVNC